MRITFSCKAPRRLLATSEQRAVMVQEKATTSEMVSPKYNIVRLIKISPPFGGDKKSFYLT